MRYVPTGKAVTAFNVEVPRQSTESDGELSDETEWFNVVAWGDLAESCKAQLVKGSTVYIGGRLQTRVWEDQDGIQCVCTEVVANEMMVLKDRMEE